MKLEWVGLVGQQVWVDSDAAASLRYMGIARCGVLFQLCRAMFFQEIFHVCWQKKIKASRTVKGELEFNMSRHECAWVMR
jgi:hypothetical protein